jgi:hypothetical protein
VDPLVVAAAQAAIDREEERKWQTLNGLKVGDCVKVRGKLVEWWDEVRVLGGEIGEWRVVYLYRQIIGY